MSEESKKRVSDYEILGQLGAGGMGRVYKVRNVISDRIEAMKILLPDLAGHQELVARFLREIKLLASLNHPNIAQLRTAFTYENQLVMIMEYLEGTTLAVRLHTGLMPLGDTLSCMDQVLNALSYAHQQNIVHRDIKPANVMLMPTGVVKVMDFGIARSDAEPALTLTGTSLGTINYMSPEQVKGEPTDPRSDLYSAGVCLYEMVTGRVPFEAGSDFSIMSAHVKEAPRPPVELQPGIPAALNEIILMAIAKDPKQRFQSATAFRNALGNVRGAEATAGAATKAIAGVAAVQSPPQVAAAAPVPSSQAAPAPVMAMAPPPAASASSHRGLYMTLGALIVLAGLVLAGIYVPKHGKAGAPQAAKTPASAAAPAPAPTDGGTPATTAAPAGEAAAPATDSAANPAAEPSSAAPAAPVDAAGDAAKMKPNAGHAGKGTAKASAVAGASGGSTEDSGTQGAEPAAPKGPDMHQIEDEVDQLTARAGAVTSSLDRLRDQQAAAGYGLRGDIAGRLESMKVNLSRAQSASERGDAAQAKKYADKTQADLDVLEKFLGR